MAEKLTTEIEDKLNDASTSGYLSGDKLAARFTDTDTDTAGQYWIRSGIAGYADDAAKHFFLPEHYTDAFDQTTTLNYDPRDLYIQSSTDPVGNSVSVEKFDFRVLAPRELKDINDNRSEVVFDVLGLPTATAVKGKGDQADNLSGFLKELPGFEEELLNPDSETLTSFFTEPRAPAEPIADYQRGQQTDARRLLGNATARHLYYFGEIEVEKTLADGSKVNVIHWGEHPPSACGIAREQHVAQLAVDKTSPMQIGFEYSDGGGNVLVTKVQAEPEAEGGPLRWIANGKTILNNKGKPVKQYEPYFSVSERVPGIVEPDHRFEEPREEGVTPIIYYDAAGRAIRTESPDGSYSRVEFSPWYVISYDPNDTAFNRDPGKQSDWYKRRTDPAHPRFPEFNTPENLRAASLIEEHADTPATVFLDSLGREVISIAHNRVKDDADTWQDKKYIAFTKLDAEGKPLWIRDDRGNLVMQYITPYKPTRADDEADPLTPEEIPPESVPCYDIAGNLLYQHSMDGGDRWIINDATGQPFYAWDKNERVAESGALIHEDRIFHTIYDDLRRPVEQHLHINGGTPQVVERSVYGDKLGLLPDAEERNLRGQVYQHYDPSGLITNHHFDFKGNLLEVTRQLASAFHTPVIHWPETPPPSAFEEEAFTQITEYDALNRMTRLYNWHRGLGTRVAVYEPRYNERGVLAGEELVVGATKTVAGYNPVRPAPDTRPAERTEAIRHIEYDAKGQRTRIEYGNNSITQYEYDPETFRLTNLLTTRPSAPTRLQELQYTYDPVGNITGMRDDAQQTAYFNNTEVDPHCSYEYDALYRLVRAEGREHAAQNTIQRDNQKFEPVTGIPFLNSPEALQNYTERYEYDEVGNILSMAHSGGAALRWKRCYQYAIDSNRLLATGGAGETPPSDDCPQHYVETPTLSQRYDYDTHGSMLTLIRTSEEYRLRWDYRDMIHIVNRGGGGWVYYNYDASKERSRKVITNRDGTKQWERFYLGGMEVYRRYGVSGVVEEIETFHLFTDDQRVLIVEDVIATDNTNLPIGTLFRYQYGNHLGSVTLEVNEAGIPITYEEYHPYGTTAYQARNRDIKAAKKRYRYTGMERDEETGLSYHSARYYLPWLGRWATADPIGIEGGINIYSYSSDSPTNRIDLSGLFDVEAYTELLADPATRPRDIQDFFRRQTNRGPVQRLHNADGTRKGAVYRINNNGRTYYARVMYGSGTAAEFRGPRVVHTTGINNTEYVHLDGDPVRPLHSVQGTPEDQRVRRAAGHEPLGTEDPPRSRRRNPTSRRRGGAGERPPRGTRFTAGQTDRVHGIPEAPAPSTRGGAGGSITSGTTGRRPGRTGGSLIVLAIVLGVSFLADDALARPHNERSIIDHAAIAANDVLTFTDPVNIASVAVDESVQVIEEEIEEETHRRQQVTGESLPLARAGVMECMFGGPGVCN